MGWKEMLWPDAIGPIPDVVRQKMAKDVMEVRTRSVTTATENLKARVEHAVKTDKKRVYRLPYDLAFGSENKFALACENLVNSEVLPIKNVSYVRLRVRPEDDWEKVHDILNAVFTFWR